MFGKLGKKTLGIQPKLRTVDQINQDYNHHAVQAGHKARVITELQGEIEQHLQRMRNIDAEARALPKTPPVATTPPAENAPTDATAPETA